MPRALAILALLFAALLPGIGAEVVQAASAGPRVALLEIDGPIDPLRAGYFKRAVDEAKRLDVDWVVVKLTTDGGRVDSAMEMLQTCLDIRERPRLAAFIDNRAYSAGAMIAFGHHRIYLTPESNIGDIGVIFQNKDGGIEYAPEKIETAVRAQLRSAAQARGWNEAKIEKMTARNQELWRFDLPDGKGGVVQHHVLEKNLPKFLDEHRPLTKENGVLIAGRDSLTTYTGKEAVEEGMATAIAKDLGEVYANIGADPAKVVSLKPTSTEEVSWVLAGWAPLLAGLAVLCIILEFKFGGTGLWLIGAAAFGVLFGICQYYQQLASYPELILVALGVVAVILEIFVLPTGGWLAIGGAGAVGLGLILAFMPDATQFHPGLPGWTGDFGHALASSTIALALVALGMALAIAALPHTRAMRRLASPAAIAGTSAGETESNIASLLGRRGTARSDLRPAGYITLPGGDGPPEDFSATTEHGEHLSAGAAIEVVSMRFGEVVVRPATERPS